MAGDEILDGGRRATIRHVHEIDAGDLLELLAHDVAGGAVALRGVGELAGVGLGMGDELAHRLGGHVGMHDQDVGRRDDVGDRREILDPVIRQLGDQVMQDGVGRVHADEQRVAVGRRFRRGFRRDRSGAAGAVLDHGDLAALAELLRQRAGDEVGDAAGRGRDDDLDRLARIGLG